MAMVKAVVFRVGQEPVVEEFENSLENFQQRVGGYIEGHSLGGGLMFYCNEDGISLNLPQNVCGILGDFVVVKVRGGDEVSVDARDILATLIWVVVNRDVKHPAMESHGAESLVTDAQLVEARELIRRFGWAHSERN